MKWTRVVTILLFLCAVAGLLLFVYPYASPRVLHRPAVLWVLSLRERFMPANAQPLAQPFVWMIFGIGGALLLTGEIEKRTRKRTTHGSAHHATRREARPYMHHARHFPHFGVQRALQIQSTTPESHLILGKYLGAVISLNEEQQASNVLLTAPIGKGKSARVVIPNLCLERGNRSLLISDVKGELERKTAGIVSQYHEVWVFAPSNAQQSEGYNPLAYIRTFEDAKVFATCWVANTGKSDDEFWPNAAIRLMTATMLHLRAAEPGAPFSRLADILVYSKYEQMKRTLTTSSSAKVREEAIPFFDYMDRNPKLIGTLMVDTSARFGVLGSDEMRVATARNDIDFRAMAERPIALYLSIPARYQNLYQPLLACFMLQAFTTWEERAEAEPTGQLPRRIMCYLDEFANLGYISNLSSYISTARHTGVGLLIVLQDFSQIVEKYGRSMLENILGNTVTQLLLPGAGKEETEYYSARIGNTTVQTETHNTRGGRGFLGERDDSWTQGETGRRLMTPDEIRTMPAENMLMLGSSSAPMVLKTRLYFEDRAMMRLANLPFHPVRIYQEPPAAPQPTHSPPDVPTHAYRKPPMVVDSDQNKKNEQGNDQYFLQK